jgi:threonine aldolase
MRQVGVLAACGLIALNDMTERLDEDHQNAKALAVGLTKIPGLL